jgi:hypothetical protein
MKLSHRKCRVRCDSQHTESQRMLWRTSTTSILYNPGIVPSSANEGILGNVHLRSNLSRKHPQSHSLWFLSRQLQPELTLVLVVSSWHSLRRAKLLSGRVFTMVTKASRSGTGCPFSCVSQCRAYRLYLWAGEPWCHRETYTPASAGANPSSLTGL